MQASIFRLESEMEKSRYVICLARFLQSSIDPFFIVGNIFVFIGISVEFLCYSGDLKNICYCSKWSLSIWNFAH